MRQIIRTCLVALTALTSGMAHGELIDSIAAVVDQEVILFSEIQGAIASEIQNIRATATSQAEFEKAINDLLLQTLEEGIAAKILYREALRASVIVDDKEVEERIDSVRNSYETNEEFMEFLNNMGETLSDNRDRVRKQIMAQRMSGTKFRELERSIVISEADVEQFYKENPEGFTRPERVYVRQIMIRSRGNTPERAEEKALLEKVRADIIAGADFGEMAKKHSELSGAENGGVIGWQVRGEQREVLEEAAFALQPGEMSKVVESQFGVHLILVEQHEAAVQVDFTDARSNIEPHIRQLRAGQEYEKWMNDLRKHSNVRIFL